MGLSWLLGLTMLFMQTPVLEGRGTWYNPYEWACTKAGRVPVMQNGHVHDINAFTAAVSLDSWSDLAGKNLLVCVQLQPVSCTCEFNCSGTPNGSGNYEQSYDESMNNPCSYGSAMGCGPLQRREMHEAAAISSGEVLPTSRLESCTTQPKCIIVTVTDTGLFGDDHIDLSVAAFRALRPYGAPYDNDGILPVRAWNLTSPPSYDTMPGAETSEDGEQ